MRLSRYEQETIVNFNESDSAATVYTLSLIHIYQPANEQELRQFVRSMRSRTKKIKKAIRAAEKMLDKSVQGG